MKILWITSKFPPEVGGVQRYVFNYAFNMADGTSVVLCPTSQDHMAGDVDAQMSSRNHRVYRRTCVRNDMGVLAHLQHPVQFIKFCWIVHRLIKSEHISVVIMGHISFYLLTAVWVLKLISKVPFVLTFHGEDIPVIQMKSNKLLRSLIWRTDSFMCNSLFTHDRLNRFLGRMKTYIIAYPGVEERFFQEADQDNANTFLVNGKTILYTVGRLDKRKGHDLVISILPEIIKRYPDIIYLIAGSGANLASLEHEVEKHNLNEYVKFLGFVPDADLPKLHAAGDIFVMPNRILDDGDTEGFGIVFLEASSSHKPVIGGKAGGAVEAIQDTFSGYLVNPYEREELLQKIIFLLSNQEAIHTMGLNGFHRAQNNYRWPLLCNKLYSELGKLINQNT